MTGQWNFSYFHHCTADLVFLKVELQPHFVYFRYFQQQFYRAIVVDFSRILTRIVGVEGEHVDQSTTTVKFGCFGSCCIAT